MTENQADSVEMMSRFHRFEIESMIFEQQVDKLYWWDSVRFDVFTFLEEQLLGRTPTPAGPRWRHLLGSTRRYFIRQKLFCKLSNQQGGLLFFRAPRTRHGDTLTDKILDPIIDLFPNQERHINTLPQRFHVPVLHSRSLTRNSPKAIEDAVTTLARSFGLSQGQTNSLAQTVQFRRHAFKVELTAYRQLLNIARPQVVVLVQNGIEKALFQAAKEYGIPTIEAQHGLINFSHVAYSYNPMISYDAQSTFPDVFLTFSEYWPTICHYPAGKSVAIGNDSHNPPPVSLQALAAIMIVSSEIHHAALTRWVRAAAKALPGRRFLYKLHPNQIPVATKISADFIDLPNIEIITGDISVTTLMQDVSHVVAICSTVVYEALQAGRRVSVLPEMNYRWHQDVLDIQVVDLPTSPSDLIRVLSEPCLSPKTIRFFDPLDPDRVRAIVGAYISDTNGATRGIQ